MIHLIENETLIDKVFEYDVILVGTNIQNALGNGFQYLVKLNFPEVDKANKETNYCDKRKLGTVKVVKTTPIFCLLYVNQGNYSPKTKPDYLDYEALEKCMSLINDNFKGKKIASTIIGFDYYEGNGDKNKIMEILNRFSTNFDLYLYDFEQVDYVKERDTRWKNIVNQLGTISHEEYENLKKEFFWYNAFGIFKPVPYELSVYELKQYIKKIKEGGN